MFCEQGMIQYGYFINIEGVYAIFCQAALDWDIPKSKSKWKPNPKSKRKHTSHLPHISRNLTLILAHLKISSGRFDFVLNIVFQ